MRDKYAVRSRYDTKSTECPVLNPSRSTAEPRVDKTGSINVGFSIKSFINYH